MKRTVLHTLPVLMMLALSACTQTGDSSPPEEAPPVTDSDAAAVLSFPSSTAGLPLDSEGAVAVDRVEVTVQPVQTQVTGLSQDADADSIVLLPGESEQVELAPGDYELESFGYGGTEDQLIAYGKSEFTVDTDTEDLDVNLDLAAIIGSVELVAVPATDSVVPGEELGVRLVALSVAPGLSLPQDVLVTDFDLDANLGELTPQGPQGAIVQLADVLPDTVRIVAAGTGLGLVDGEPQPDAQFSDELELPVTQPDADQDQVLPGITFNPPEADELILEGGVTGGYGYTHVQVFHGHELLGSSRATDLLDNSLLAEIQLIDEKWSMNWQPEAAVSYTLRAVAQDMRDNSDVAFQSLNVTPPADRDDLQAYRTVADASGTQPDAPETFPDAGACAANEFSLPGQGLQAVGAGLQAVGAVGGLSYVPAAGLPEKTAYGIGKEHTAVLTRWRGDPGQDIDDMHDSFRMLGDVRDRVVIMVVDDFGEDDYELPPGLLDGSMPPVQLQQLAEDGGLTHGALVLHHTLQNLNAMTGLAEADIRQVTNDRTGEPYYVYYTRQEDLDDPGFLGTEKSFIVHPVNTAGRTMDELGAYIRDSIEGMTYSTAPRIVINFSFVIMPCSITADFAASGIRSFEDYAEAVAAINGMSGSAEQVMEVSSGGGSYGLTEFLACPSGLPGQCTGGAFSDVSHLVYVGSAGNYGHDYPLYPAAEPGVIAVGSVPTNTVGHGDEKSDYSNSGNILTPGSLLLGGAEGDMVWRYDGTSFAAPNASTYLAGELAVVAGMGCFGEPNMEPDGPRAPGFADLSNIVLYDWYGGPEALSEVCQHDHQ